MRPQLQSIADELGGQFGDCHRTCIAMILDMDRDEVPHFMVDVPPGQPADHPDSVAAELAERRWLADRGLAIVNVPMDGGSSLEAVLEALTGWARDTAVILGGATASGICHSVVFYRGRVYDPRGGPCSLVGPQPCGYWFVTVYAHLTQPIADPVEREDQPYFEQLHGRAGRPSVVTQED